jgi:hypothetical protein
LLVKDFHCFLLLVQSLPTGNALTFLALSLFVVPSRAKVEGRIHSVEKNLNSSGPYTSLFVEQRSIDVAIRQLAPIMNFPGKQPVPTMEAAQPQECDDEKNTPATSQFSEPTPIATT